MTKPLKTQERARSQVEEFARTGDVGELVRNIGACCRDYGKYGPDNRLRYQDFLVEELNKLDWVQVGKKISVYQVLKRLGVEVGDNS